MIYHQAKWGQQNVKVWLSFILFQSKNVLELDTKQYQSNHFFFYFFLKAKLIFPVPRWVGDNTDLPSNKNISKTISANVAFFPSFLKECSISFVLVFRLIDFALVILWLLMLKVCGIIGIWKIEFFNFSVNEWVKKSQKW